MLKRFITILSLIILLISFAYCYNDDSDYHTFCYNYTNANNESIPFEICFKQYGKGYYCCGTCKNRTCCNDTSQFLIQKECDNTYLTGIFVNWALLFGILSPMICCTSVFLCIIFCGCICIIKELIFSLLSNIKRRIRRIFPKDFANTEVNPIRNSNPNPDPRRISSQNLNSTQFDILPTYNMVINYDPNLPSYESIVSNKESKFNTTQL